MADLIFHAAGILNFQQPLLPSYYGEGKRIKTKLCIQSEWQIVHCHILSVMTLLFTSLQIQKRNSLIYGRRTFCIFNICLPMFFHCSFYRFCNRVEYNRDHNHKKLVFELHEKSRLTEIRHCTPFKPTSTYFGGRGTLN